METLEEIWEGDLLDRRREAEDLVGYLESVAGRPAIREDGHAHVMAIDTPYGQGKTFFLRRLDRHLRATDHVSAYIDTWVDDLEDEPIVALAATLDEALEPWATKSEAVATGLEQFKARAGRVAKIVGIGLAKRGAGFLITQAAAEALSSELAAANETSRDIAKEALQDGGNSTVDDLSNALERVTPSMQKRIERFREGQTAIQAMKDSLSAVVNALQQEGMNLPITIIVDELDRCRPTYAIKVLEEIKHLFDVQGVAFLLGIHGDQLEHSITGAYGQGFDGSAYLRRFFSRRYTLRESSLATLVRYLIDALRIDISLIRHPLVKRNGDERTTEIEIPDLIADYITAYNLSARDLFGVLERLHTALAIIGKRPVNLAYLLPLVIFQSLGSDELVKTTNRPKWTLAFASMRINGGYDEFTIDDFVLNLDRAASMNDRQLSSQINLNDHFARVVAEIGFRNSSNEYHLLQNYRNLVRAVSRFS